MIGVIPNPKKTISIDKSPASIKDAILLIPLFNAKYKLGECDDVLKQYSFEATEFLSLGVIIDVNLSVDSEEKTSVTIEVKRKIGSFDKTHEVTNANEHIDKLFKLISQGVQMSKEEIIELRNKAENEKPVLTAKQEQNQSTNTIILAVFALVAIGAAVYFIFIK